MQFSNSDMDELFRKAADHYPLKTDNANWDKISEALDAPEEDKPAAFSFGKTAVAFVILMLLAGTTCYFIMNDKTEEKNTAVKIIAPAKKTTTAVTKITTEKKSTNNIVPAIVGPSLTVNEKNTVNNLRSVPVKMSASGGTSEPADLSLKTISQQDKATVAKTDATETNKSPVIAKIDAVEKRTEQTEVTSEIIKTAPTKQAVTEKKENEKTGEVNKATVVKSEKSKKSTLYMIAVAGLDKSHVALQRFSKLGTSYGLTAGFNLNSHFSIEAGLLSSSKKYYTGAQYFNTAKLNSPAYVKWRNFEGECRMLEIPVVIRYNFDAGKNAQWFLTGGVSSYLMRKEIYDYHYDAYGQAKTGTNTYNNSSKDWLSALHISGGVETNLSKKSSLRIEPYIRIPVKKMGYGDLPISSMGINFGIRRNLF
jgi:opacity protein-like surface antigen